MFRLIYSINDKLYKKYFDGFDDLYYFVNLGLFVNKTFYVVKIFDIKSDEVIL